MGLFWIVMDCFEMFWTVFSKTFQKQSLRFKTMKYDGRNEHYEKFRNVLDCLTKRLGFIKGYVLSWRVYKVIIKGLFTRGYGLQGVGVRIL